MSGNYSDTTLQLCTELFGLIRDGTRYVVRSVSSGLKLKLTHLGHLHLSRALGPSSSIAARHQHLHPHRRGVLHRRQRRLLRPPPLEDRLHNRQRRRGMFFLKPLPRLS